MKVKATVRSSSKSSFMDGEKHPWFVSKPCCAGSNKVNVGGGSSWEPKDFENPWAETKDARL